MSGLRVEAVIEDRDIDVELSVAEGTVTAILGPNGAGKSSLLSVVAGLYRPDRGRVELNGHVLADTAASVLVPPHKRSVALLAQQAMLFPHMDVETNVAFAPRSAGRSRTEAKRAAEHWLAAVDAGELARRRPGQLSGGQAQRVAVARALAAEPDLLLLDEPMAALDVSAAPALRTLLRRVLRTEGRTALLVTHDALDALALADNVVVMDAGRIVERGDVSHVLSSPRSAFAARIAGINLRDGVIGPGGQLQTTAGALVYGTAAEPLTPGENAVAVFSPGAVAVYPVLPEGSPRNHFAVTVAAIENRGDLIRVRGEDFGDETGLMADVTPAAAAELDLEPGLTVHFVVKATETAIYPAVTRRRS